MVITLLVISDFSPTCSATEILIVCECHDSFQCHHFWHHYLLLLSPKMLAGLDATATAAAFEQASTEWSLYVGAINTALGLHH